MEEVIDFLEFFTKLLYGTHLSAAFSGLTFGNNKKKYLTLMAMVILLQNIGYLLVGESTVTHIYPFLIHIPIIIYLYKRAEVPLLHGFMALILAFQLLTCRIWLGGFFSFITVHTPFAHNCFTVLFSIPLAFFLGKYLAPPIAKLKSESKIMLTVSFIPITYYIFGMIHYIWGIYAFDSVETFEYLLNYIDGWFILVFIVYTVISMGIFNEKKQVDIERAVLFNIQNHTADNLKQLHKQYELEQLQKHDMRHHGNYLLSLLPVGTDERITDYIQSVLINQKFSPLLLSNNESLNLVLNHYKKKADEFDILFEIQIEVVDYSSFSTIDLCTLLSNGLENAVNACKELSQEKRNISLKMRTNNSTLSIDLRNTFSKQPQFVDDLPITIEEAHGYGTKSMLRICEKYNGITRFCVIEKKFCFQTVLQNEKI
ncbi:MAG: ATP-binding protein [Eubacteriales bacterium]